MSEIFLTVVNMSISASFVVLAVLLLRLLLKKAPKWTTVLLWGVVAVRLICPFSFESEMSLIPSAKTISPEIMMETAPEINTGIPVVNEVINPVITETFSPDMADSANPLQILIPVLSVVWITGIAVMLAYTVISYLRLKSKMGTAVLLRDNIYQSEAVTSPFVLGIIKPKIYLPFNINERDMEYVIAHEQSHIHGKDNLWKPLGFVLLSLHWFNPLIWLSFVLLCRDIELACDEKVIKEFNKEQKADYSQALLACSVNKRMVAFSPLAFGEVGVKDRVKSVLNYKKPAFYIVILAIVLSVAVAVCFLTNPETDKGYKEYYDSGYSLQVTVKTDKETDEYSFDVLNGTKGEFRNGTKFEVAECDLQSGTLTISLSGTPLYSVPRVKEIPSEEIFVDEGAKGVVLSDKKNKYFFTFKFEETGSLDEAVSKAILDDNKTGYYVFGTECAAEGHIIYGTEVIGDEYKVYAFTNYANFGFQNGYFVNVSGGSSPAVMTFQKTYSGYELIDIKYPQDGEGYAESMKELFPEKYYRKVMNPSSEDFESMWNQQVAYAKSYLDKIGRNEEIRNYSQVEHTILTEAGVSVEVSNKILEYKLPYDYFLGYYEAIENNVRYIYRMDYDENQNKIICTKEVYDTKEIVERIEIDSLTGDIISK